MTTKHGDLSKGVPVAEDISLQSLSEVPRHPKGTNQSRSIGLMQKSEDYDRIEEENKFVKMAGTVDSRPTGKGA